MAIYFLQTRKYGFLFEDDEEAAIFSSKVTSQFSTGSSECSDLPFPVYILIQRIQKRQRDQRA
jgi:hypothetical protein